MKFIYVVLLLFYGLNANEIAVVSDVKGYVVAKNSDTFITLIDGVSLNEGMTLLTNEDSSITVRFDDSSKLVLGSNAILNLNKYVFKPEENKYDFELFLEEGSISFESGKISELSPEDFVLKISDKTVSIRGKKFFIKVQ